MQIGDAAHRQPGQVGDLMPCGARDRDGQSPIEAAPAAGRVC
jgi:hypothetical protein